MSDVILRKFWLENESGNAIPLNGEQGIWLVDPTGLGMASNSSFTDFGHGFFRSVDKEKDPQQTVAGDLYFIDHRNPYVEYKRFADWVVQAETLYLVYQPASIQYRRKVLLSSITKEELLTQELLKCPVAFYGLTPWFIKTDYVIPAKEESNATPFRVSGEPDDDSSLPLVLDGNTPDGIPYPSRLGDSVNTTYHRLQLDNRYRSSIEIYPTGQKPAGFVLQYTGVLINPMVLVRERSGSVIGQCGLVNASVNNDETLIYSSDYENSGIMKLGRYSNNDLIDFVENLQVELYPKLPVNTMDSIELSADNEITGEVRITLIEYYRGV